MRLGDHFDIIIAAKPLFSKKVPQTEVEKIMCPEKKAFAMLFGLNAKACLTLIWDLAFKPCHEIALFFRLLLVKIAAQICAPSTGTAK